MTLQQTLQASTKATEELFGKLENTSNQAVKTRENLFVELSRELRLYAELEQRELFPALRKHDKTKDLVSEAAKSTRDLSARVNELEAMPKGDDTFLPRLKDLRKVFQQHLRDERRELLPAVQKALSDEEAEAVAQRIETRRNGAEAEQRADEEERKQAARRGREREKQVEERARAVAQAVDASTESVKDLGHAASGAVQQGVQSAEQATLKGLGVASDAARRVKDQVTDTMTTYRDTVRERGQDVQAVAAALGSYRQVQSDLNSLMRDALGRSARNSLETTRRLVSNPLQYGEVQREFVETATRNMLETTKEMLQIFGRASAQASRPIEQRLQEVS